MRGWDITPAVCEYLCAGNKRTRYMKEKYMTPAVEIEQQWMEEAILQASGDYLRDDYGYWITDEWGN